MTIILGMYYDHQKGGLIASDSRAEIDLVSYDLIRKIELQDGLVLSIAGDSYKGDELLENIIPTLREISKDDPKRRKKIRTVIKEKQRELEKEYKSTKKKGEDEEDDVGVFGFYTTHPEIFCLTEKGNVGAITSGFETAGLVPNGARGLLKAFYHPDISREQAMVLAAYVIVNSSNNYHQIDDNPQMALIEKDGIKILNSYGENFLFKTPEIEELKMRSREILLGQKKVFDVLSGSSEESKSKLVRMLGEF